MAQKVIHMKNIHRSLNWLMRHLRRLGIGIHGKSQKRKLLNSGYFHGYKGYRFYENGSTILPFISYNEVEATIKYDSGIKSLVYGPMIFIETASKNISLEKILEKSVSPYVSDMFASVISGYRNAPPSYLDGQKEKLQQKKLNLQNKVQSILANAYRKKDPKITHFYNNPKYDDVPIWALFEILTMGQFGNLLSCLTYDVRDAISKEIGFNLSCDTNRELVFRYIYALRELRNAVAHNGVVFDTRFRKYYPNQPMKRCLKMEIGLPYVNFDTIGDYIILIAYFLKLFHKPRKEILSFIRKFERLTEDYRKAVNPQVSKIAIHPDLASRMAILKKFV